MDEIRLIDNNHIEKIIGRCILIFILLWTMVGLIFAEMEVIPRKTDLSDVAVDDTSKYTYSLAETESLNFVETKGWFVKNKQDTDHVTLGMSVVYYDDAKDKWYVLPTIVTENKEAREEMADECIYKWSGISSKGFKGLLGDYKAYKKYILYELNGERTLILVE